MAKELSYRDYVNDAAHMQQYSDYQKRYARKIRESDRTMVEIIGDLAGKRLETDKPLTLLDIGCSTGNLLLHLKHFLPNADLYGGDIVSSIIAECRNNAELAGVRFEEMDMLNLDRQEKFDIVVANAAMMFFSENEFDRALQNISKVIKEAGSLIAFDFFHPFEQEVTVIEKSKLFPNDLKFYFRGYAKVRAGLEEAGFSNPVFRPFNIPIDLDQSEDSSDVTSYTVRTENGERLCFRGTLFQPWCHLMVQKVPTV
jgi:SAM-dependent methyltransferase